MSDSEDDDEEGCVARQGHTYSQEQSALKASFKAAAEVEGEGDLLVPRRKTQEEKVGRGCGVCMLGCGL